MHSFCYGGPAGSPAVDHSSTTMYQRATISVFSRSSVDSSSCCQKLRKPHLLRAGSSLVVVRSLSLPGGEDLARHNTTQVWTTTSPHMCVMWVPAFTWFLCDSGLPGRPQELRGLCPWWQGCPSYSEPCHLGKTNPYSTETIWRRTKKCVVT